MVHIQKIFKKIFLNMIWRSKSKLRHKVHPIICTTYEEKAYNSGKKKAFHWHLGQKEIQNNSIILTILSSVY